MTDNKLLPLPKWLLDGFTDTTIEMLCDYTYANVVHATAAQAAEIDALRTRLEDTVRDSTNEIESLLAENKGHGIAIQQLCDRAEQLRADKLDLEAALEYTKSHKEIAAMNQHGIIKALSEIRDEYGVEIHKLRSEVERLSALLGQAEHSLANIANAQYLRAERLAEVLREAQKLFEWNAIGGPLRRRIDALLRDHDQEVGNG